MSYDKDILKNINLAEFYDNISIRNKIAEKQLKLTTNKNAIIALETAIGIYNYILNYLGRE